MERDYGKEIDMLQNELNHLQSEISKQNKEVERLCRLVESLVNGSSQVRGQGISSNINGTEGNNYSNAPQGILQDLEKHLKDNAKDLNMCPRARELKKKADAEGWKGAIDSYSTFSCNGYGYFTDLPPVSADSLLNLDNDLVARVLSTFSHKQRIAILKAVLEEPLSASQILEKLNMGTTGQVYHHINALLAADLIKQEDNGKYVFKGHRVHAFLLILAGVRHVLDESYSKGSWTVEEAQNTEGNE